MSIKLDIDLDALRDPAVARALADLMVALGQGTSAPVSVRAQFSAPAVAVAAAEAAPRSARKSRRQMLRGDAAERYARFVAGLPERSQRFLDLVKTRGLVRMGEAMKALGVEIPKAMGGITGSIGRWAPERGVTVPYETISLEGERAWKWIGEPGASDD